MIEHCLYTNAVEAEVESPASPALEAINSEASHGVSGKSGSSPPEGDLDEQEVWPLCRTEDERVAAYALL